MTADERIKRRSVGPGKVIEPLRILLGNRALTWLVTAFAILTVAEWGYVTALAVDAFRMHGAIAVGLVGFRLFFAAIGSFLCLPFVERHPGARVLTAVAGIRAAVVGASAGLAAVGAPFTLLLVLVAVDAVVSSPYRPAQSAMLPYLARTPRELAASAAGVSTVKTLSQALGGMGGGFVLVIATPATAFAVAAGLLVAAGLVTMRFAHTPIPAGPPVLSNRVRERVRGMVDVVRTPHVGGLLVASGLRTFVRGMWIALAVIAALRLLHAGSVGVGLLMVATGLGSVAAVPISATLIDRTRLGTPAAVALISCGIPLGIIAGFPVLDVALAFMAAWGIGMAVADVATLSLLYRVLDLPLLPRVTAVIESAKLALEGLGALLAPLLVSTIGVRGALIAAAVPLPVVVLAGWNMLRRLDTAAGERARVLALLHGAPCLEPLDMAALESLVGAATRVGVPAGTDVVRQGDAGDRFYVVAAGTADVLVDGFCVGEVAAGGSFGERALLRESPRTATVRSREPMQLLALSRDSFVTALTGQAGGKGTAEAQLPATHADWSRRERIHLLSRLGLFSHLDSGTLRELADKSVVDRWPAGATIIEQGEDGDRFFVLMDGRAAVLMDGEAVGELHPGDQFGEIALLHGVPRTARVSATVPVVTLSLHHDDFVSAVRSRVLLG